MSQTEPEPVYIGPSQEQVEAEPEGYYVPDEYVQAAEGQEVVFESKVDYEFTGVPEPEPAKKTAQKAP